MFIDVHAHAFHPKIANKVLNQLKDHYSITPVGSGLLDDLLDRTHKAGLDKAVILTAATTPAQVVPANDWAIAIKKKYPDCIPFGTIHPDFNQMEDELDRLEQAGILGLKFHPDFQGFRMDDPALYDVMEIIGDRFVCLFHVGDTLPPDENPSCPRKLAALHKAFPAPPIIAAHMGGYQHWDYALDYLVDSDIFVDSSSSIDFLDDRMLKRLFNAFGTERILFGSDYPLFDAGEERNKLEKRLKLTTSEMESILGNAAGLLSES